MKPLLILVLIVAAWAIGEFHGQRRQSAVDAPVIRAACAALIQSMQDNEDLRAAYEPTGPTVQVPTMAANGAQ